jgi:hypothetical protein
MLPVVVCAMPLVATAHTATTPKHNNVNLEDAMTRSFRWNFAKNVSVVLP